MQPFDLSDFLATFDPAVLLLTVTLGSSLGIALARMGRDSFASIEHLFWQLTAGAIFLIPIALLRSFEGRVLWERLLADFPLYIVFYLAMHVAARWCDGRWCDAEDK